MYDSKKQPKPLIIQCNHFTYSLLIKETDLLRKRLNGLLNEIAEAGFTHRISKIAELALSPLYFDPIFKVKPTLSIEFLPCQNIIYILEHLEHEAVVNLIQMYFKRYLAQELGAKSWNGLLLREYAHQIIMGENKHSNHERLEPVPLLSERIGEAQL